MSFSSKWLSLREPIDRAARNDRILSEVAKQFEGRTQINITDIGGGTGATIRGLNSSLGPKINWHLIDNDIRLINIAEQQISSDDVALTFADLSQSLSEIFSSKPNLITTSAFLDLVSQDWLEDFVEAVVNLRLPVYAALTYDGRTACTPPLDTDDEIIKAFNHHQTGDKGFGPALGPQAAETAVMLFQNAGYDVQSERSDWHAGPEHKEFQKMLLDGWCAAATEIMPERIHTFKDWLAHRYRLIDDDDAEVMVGHIDFFAKPRG